jgi:hypothetical protein
MSRTLRLAPMVVVIAVAIAGCGGSSSATNTKAQLIAQADPICKQVALKRAAANKAVEKVGSSTTKELQVLARLAPPIAAEEHAAVAQLHALKAPTSLEADWQQLLAGIGQLADDTTEIAAHAKSNDLKGVESVTSSGRKLREQLTAIAKRDGFTYCGRTS